MSLINPWPISIEYSFVRSSADSLLVFVLGKSLIGHLLIWTSDIRLRGFSVWNPQLAGSKTSPDKRAMQELRLDRETFDGQQLALNCFYLFDDCWPCFPEDPVTTDALHLRKFHQFFLRGSGATSHTFVHGTNEYLLRLCYLGLLRTLRPIFWHFGLRVGSQYFCFF